MDLHEIFRSFFGIRHRSHHDTYYDEFGSQPEYSSDDITSDNDTEDLDHFFHGGFGSYSFSEPFEKMKQLEELFHGIGFHNFNELPFRNEESSPRDDMLKSPDTERTDRLPQFHGWWSPPRNIPFSKKSDVDKDLDDKVASGGLKEILSENEDRKILPTQPNFKSFQKFVSVRTIKENGKVEQYRTVKDSTGNEETTVSRSLGDQTYSVTTRTDVSGTVEEQKDFVNMDEKGIEEFQKKWEDNSRRMLPSNPREELLLIPEQRSQGDNESYFRIFHRLFDKSCNK